MLDADPAFRPVRRRDGYLPLPSTFWLVENLARQGRLDDAAELYASLCARASALGLLPEQIDPSSGEFSGNLPQAFSHIGVIAAGVTLARALDGSRPFGPS